MTIAELVPTKSDKEKAAEHREKIVEASKTLMDALTLARADGFLAQLQFGEDAFHRVVITHFGLMKSF